VPAKVGKLFSRERHLLSFNKPNMENLKKWFIWASLVTLAGQTAAVNMQAAFALTGVGVVINEVAWAGTTENSNDEWIELYNNTSAQVDLTGWQIVDDNGASVYQVTSGMVAGHGFFLIEDREEAVANVTAGAVIGLSLANSGDSLVLKDAGGNVVDTVNGGGGAWYAGSNTSKATMERKDPAMTVDSADNWASGGTPAMANTNYAGGVKVELLGPSSVSKNEVVTVSVKIGQVEDLYAYGVELKYDPAFLNFVSAEEGDFLKQGGTTTAFSSGLENGQQGVLVIGNARLNTEDGVSGSAEIFNADFKVVGASGSSNLSFGSGSFLADSVGDLPTNFQPLTFNIGASASVGTVGGLKIEAGDARYSLEISWTAPANGADSYIVMKKGADGNFVSIGTSQVLSFVDDKNLIPNLEYEYQVIAVKGGVQGSATTIKGSETRGVKGDFDRSDRVDGRDLEKLAKAYGSKSGDQKFDAWADTNYDGKIDGSDLIDLGTNFGMKYQ